MSDVKLPKEKHLTQEAREAMQTWLEAGVSFKDIARRLGKAATTISREVKKHIVVKEASVKHTKADGNPAGVCPQLLKAPFICNPCPKRNYCSLQKQFYYAGSAHREYKDVLVSAREGTPLNKEAFYEADAIITAGIKKGQRLYHIMKSTDIGFSKSSAYRYLHKDYLSVNKLDFPRVVKFKTRKQYRVAGVPKALKIDRTYDDFKVYIEKNSINHYVEMDTVIGCIGGKVIMTFHFTRDNFMIGLLMDNKSSAEATDKIRALKKRLTTGGVCFGDIFPVLLTDNGGEFSNVAAFTEDANGTVESKMFFCDPYRSCQKPHIEKNHTIFRDIVPKHFSFDNFTQETVNLIFSHVNGIKRASLFGKSPYDLFSFVHGDSLPALLGISRINAADVVQSPKLLKDTKKTPPSIPNLPNPATLTIGGVSCD